MVRIEIKESKIFSKVNEVGSNNVLSDSRYSFQRPIYFSHPQKDTQRYIKQITCPVYDGSLRGAAESCAAVLIQSIWRGRFNRRKNSGLNRKVHEEEKLRVPTLIEDSLQFQDEKMLPLPQLSIQKINSPTVTCTPPKDNQILMGRKRKEKIMEGCQLGYSKTTKHPLKLKHSYLMALFYLQEEPSLTMRKKYEQFLLTDISANTKRRSKHEPTYQFPLEISVEDIRKLYSTVFRWERRHHSFNRSKKSITDEVARKIQISVLTFLKPPREALSFVLSHKSIHGR